MAQLRRNSFQGIALHFQVFSTFFCQNMLKNEIFILKFCPQSVLKHSMIDFQGIAMIFLKI